MEVFRRSKNMNTGIVFEARNKTVRDVLFANYAYQVPRYQRPYAWEIDQASEFWNDLISGDQAPFIGSLIFNYEPYEKTRHIDISSSWNNVNRIF